MNYKKLITIPGIFILFSFLINSAFSADHEEKKPSSKEKEKITLPLPYTPGIKTTYIDNNTSELIEKSEVKRGKIYYYDKKGELKRTGNITGNTVLYDRGDVKRERILGNKIYQYDKDGKLLGKIWVRPYEIKKVLPDGRIEKFKIKINR